MSNKQYLLALNRCPTIGPRTLMKLQERWPELKDMFVLKESALEQAGLPKKLAQAISQCTLKATEDDLRWEEGENHHLLTWDDPFYPSPLKEIHAPPPVLYAKGELSCLKQNMLGMVGTRKPSPTGRETARTFAKQLASLGFNIVSGLAYGIDAEAHQGCLAVGGPTIAVMGTGIDHIYHKTHHQLAEKITETGLVLTEFPLKSSANAGHFPQRNRIISGLSLAILVVEAAVRSGSLITARMALEQNREVLAVPGSIHNPQARGCHYLLQQGAKLVTSAQDVIDELGFCIPLPNNKTSPIKSKVNATSSPILACIGFEPTSMDDIINRSHYDIARAACELAELELQGLITAVPGGYARYMA